MGDLFSDFAEVFDAQVEPGRDERRFGGMPRAPVGREPCAHMLDGEVADAYAVVCRDCGVWWPGREVRAKRDGGRT
jgi:hypothetical protein